MDGLSINFSFGASVVGACHSLDSILAEYKDKCENAVKYYSSADTNSEGLGWLDLPLADTALINEAADWLKSYDYIVHVGIGGSALGNLMLNQALFGEFYNDADTRLRPKFYLADNPDPTKTQAIWDIVKSGKTALVGVSKSGATAETMSQFLWFRDKMQESFGDVSKDILVITDPSNGIFRAFANDTGCRVLDLPPSVGGRYSVLSSAGLVSARALGIDTEALLEGAALMRKALISNADIKSNPACVMAALSCFHESSDRPMSVLMPYSSRMAYFAEWFAQLWGESLGKNGLGTTPVRAVGAIDQHSQVQLYTEGPDDKFFTIINIANHGASVTIPVSDEKSLSPLSYMYGADIGNMLGLEAMSTAAALVKSTRPVVWIEVERLDEKNLGGLIFFYEYMTAVTGHVMGINPFDQPGVEQGKKYTYGLMGRKGNEKDAAQANEYFSGIKAYGIEI